MSAQEKEKQNHEEYKCKRPIILIYHPGPYVSDIFFLVPSFWGVFYNIVLIKKLDKNRTLNISRIFVIHLQ